MVKRCNGDRCCVSGGYFRLNDLGPCEVAIAPATWSHVKALYLDSAR